MITPTKFDNAPTATVDAIAPAGAAIDERRTAKRLVRELSVNLTGMGCTEGHRCTADDISESGVYLRVPKGYDLVVGQRCEVSFGSVAASAELSCLTGATCYATVVRTRRDLGGARQVMGAGLRFDQPLFF